MSKEKQFQWDEMNVKRFAVWFNNESSSSLVPLSIDKSLDSFKEVFNLVKSFNEKDTYDVCSTDFYETLTNFNGTKFFPRHLGDYQIFSIETAQYLLNLKCICSLIDNVRTYKFGVFDNKKEWMGGAISILSQGDKIKIIINDKMDFNVKFVDIKLIESCIEISKNMSLSFKEAFRKKIKSLI